MIISNQLTYDQIVEFVREALSNDTPLDKVFIGNYWKEKPTNELSFSFIFPSKDTGSLITSCLVRPWADTIMFFTAKPLSRVSFDDFFYATDSTMDVTLQEVRNISFDYPVVGDHVESCLQTAFDDAVNEVGELYGPEARDWAESALKFKLEGTV